MLLFWFLDPSVPVLLNVYRLNDSRLGFYHTGLVYHRAEFTFCQDTGIYCHAPRDCAWATFLGSVRLGSTLTTQKRFNHMVLGKSLVKWEAIRETIIYYFFAKMASSINFLFKELYL